MAELAKEYDINPVMISTWMADFLENISATFEKSKNTQAVEQDTQELFATIGQLKVENKILKPACRQAGKVAGSWGSSYEILLGGTPYFTAFYPQTMRTIIHQSQQRTL